MEGAKVTIVEKEQIGREASWAAAGILAPHHQTPVNPQFFLLGLKSLQMYHELTQQLFTQTEINVGYDVHGALAVFYENKKFEDSKEQLRWQIEMGSHLTWLSRQEVLAKEPDLAEDTVGAIWIPGDHQVDNRALLDVLVQSLIQSGVEMYEKHAVTELIIENNKVSGVKTAQEEFFADWVINAAGCWAGEIAVSDLFRPPVRPIRGELLALDMSGIAHFEHVIYANQVYLVPRKDGRLIVGATSEDVGFANTTTARGIHNLLERAMVISAKIGDMPVKSVWSGLRPGTKDHLPILGPTSLAGYLLATGHYRNGILLAPITAKLISDYVRTKEIPDLMRPFLLERFWV